MKKNIHNILNAPYFYFILYFLKVNVYLIIEIPFQIAI
jgi:hypothetical protein